MPTLSGASIGATFSALLLNTLDRRQAQDSLGFNPNYVFTDGNGAGLAQQGFLDDRTLTASSNESLDLAGGLTDGFGATITFTKIKVLLIKAADTNVNDVLVGGAASNGFATPFGDPTDVMRVKPGGMLLLVAPDAAGYAVTAATGDLLKIANSAGGTSVTYTIALLGTL